MIRASIMISIGDRLDDAYRDFSDKVRAAKCSDQYPSYEDFCARIDAIKAAALEEFKRNESTKD